MTAVPFMPTPADMQAVFRGVALSEYGDWSDYVALGHVDPPLMVAACQAVSQDWGGVPVGGGLPDDRLAAHVVHRWATFTRDADGWEFVNTTDPLPGSLPVTFLAVG